MNLSQRMQGVDPNNLNQFATSVANQQQNGVHLHLMYRMDRRISNGSRRI